MYFNYRDFLKALRIALFQKPFRLRRWLYVLFFSSLYLSFMILVALLRGLDTLLFPDFRKVEIKQPVFIIAPPRSGTTFLQKVLCQDEERFIYWKMYQTIFPSICFQKLVNGLAWTNRKLGGAITRSMERLEKKWFGGWDDRHRMRLNQAEEDGAIFLYAFASEAIFMLFPFVNELWKVGFPDALPAEQRRRLMTYYRSCLQRQMYSEGHGRVMLVKNTQSSGAIESIQEEFPDALFITIMRHPFNSIASHVSLFVPAWQTHSPEIAKNGQESKAYAGLAVEWYKHLFRFRSQVAMENYFCIDYRSLRDDPAGTVEALYAHFGWIMSEAYRAKLIDIGKQNKSFRSKHVYSLEEFGLSRQWLQKELAPILEAYNLV
jgi:omega-hydroxy-beta-dihydromenaquinone-9 sulfotransferase